MNRIRNFFRNWGVTLAVIVGLLLLAFFTGISFWLMLGIVFFFTSVKLVYTGGRITSQSKALAVVMVILFSLAVVDSYWEANFQLSYAKKEVAKSRLDQLASWIMGDRTETQAKGAWELAKDQNGKSFLKYYKRLLAQGRTKEAFDTLQAFKEAWDMENFEPIEGPENDFVSGDDEPSDEGIGTSMESFTLHQGEQWFPDHLFQEGDVVRYQVEYAAVKRLYPDGTSSTLSPGRTYMETITATGRPIFEGLGELSKITVRY